MKQKKHKYHWYRDNCTIDPDGYGKTACGREGRIVGGFITGFFVLVRPKEACKTCIKLFKRKK